MKMCMNKFHLGKIVRPLIFHGRFSSLHSISQNFHSLVLVPLWVILSRLTFFFHGRHLDNWRHFSCPVLFPHIFTLPGPFLIRHDSWILPFSFFFCLNIIFSNSLPFLFCLNFCLFVFGCYRSSLYVVHGFFVTAWGIFSCDQIRY